MDTRHHTHTIPGAGTPGGGGPSRGTEGLLARLGGWCFDHRWAAIGTWLAVMIAVLGTAGAVGADFSASSDAPDSESSEGLAVMAEHFPQLGASGISGTIVFQADQGVDDPEVMATMNELFALVDAGFPDADGVATHPGATVISPYEPAGQGQVAFEGPLAGQLAYAQVNLAASITDTDAGLIGEQIRDWVDEHTGTGADTGAAAGLEILTGGQYLAVIEPPETELIGLAFAVVVLIIAFGSVLAMSLPIAVAIGGVGIGIGSITLLSNAVDAPDFTPIIGIMIGLGVGIDYALFIVTRYREGLDRGLDTRAAAVTAIDTAGRAVLFAGVTVVISMLGLLLIGLGWLAGMGLGVSLTVLATMLTSVTLLPALLGLAGRRVEVTRWRGLIAAGFVALAFGALGLGQPTIALAALAGVGAVLALSVVVRPLRREVPRRRETPRSLSLAYRWSRTIQRHPWRWLLVGTTVLVAFSAPVFGLRLGWADEGNYPAETEARQAYDLLADGFGPGFNGPLVITAVPTDGEDGDAGDGDGVAALAEALATTPGVAAVTPPVPSADVDPEAWLLTVVPTTAPQDRATTELVTTLRDEVIPAAVVGTGLDVDVTGQAAVQNDITDFLSARMLVFFGAVLALSFVLLMVVFRSLLVPIKAVIMNVLSIAGAYGAVVAVFQWGWAGDLLGLEGAPINPFIPMMLFAIVFGLSMDYEVFLLSRIREEFVRTGDSARSVADGLASTARVISAAAAIMVVVFGSFLFEDIREVKLFGLGLALAVLLDATLVRMLLVPATMELLGDRNWWIPVWLDRVLPRLSVEGPAGGHEPVTQIGRATTAADAADDGDDADDADDVGPERGRALVTTE